MPVENEIRIPLNKPLKKQNARKKRLTLRRDKADLEEKKHSLRLPDAFVAETSNPPQIRSNGYLDFDTTILYSI